MTRVIVEDAQFTSILAEPQQFVAYDSDDSELKCIANVTVDDNLILTNCLPLRDRLLAALTARFGPLTVNLDSTMHAGIEMLRLSNSGILLTQTKAIARAASVVGVAHMPPVSVPAELSFFLPSFEGDEAALVDSGSYLSLTGKLVQFLKTRSDVKLLVSYLCAHNLSPAEGHFRRALHVLRYLVSTPTMGPVFHSDCLTLCVYTDAAFGVFRDGYSSTGVLFCIGRYNAPFHVIAQSQSDVPTCPMTAEYYAANAACKTLMYLCKLRSQLGWERSIIPFYMDNMTSINLPRVAILNSIII